MRGGPGERLEPALCVLDVREEQPATEDCERSTADATPGRLRGAHIAALRPDAAPDRDVHARSEHSEELRGLIELRGEVGVQIENDIAGGGERPCCILQSAPDHFVLHFFDRFTHTHTPAIISIRPATRIMIIVLSIAFSPIRHVLFRMHSPMRSRNEASSQR